MMGDAKKKSATVIIEKPEVESDYSPGKEAAAEDIMKAIESKDAKLLVSAFEDLFAMCSDEHEGSEMPEDEEEEKAPEYDVAEKLRKKLGWK